MKNEFKDYNHLFYDYKWSIHEQEKPTWDYLQTFLRPGCTFFDVGCQKGIYSKGVLDLYGDDCFVYGFDVLQHPEILDLEKKYENFKFNHSAVGDGKTKEDCVIHYDSDTKLEQQKTISLDQFCKDNSITKVDFIKIDVDGIQNSVIKGSVNILKNLNPILIIELNSNFGNDITSSDEYCSMVSNENDLELFKIMKLNSYKSISVRNGSNVFFKKEI